MPLMFTVWRRKDAQLCFGAVLAVIVLDFALLPFTTFTVDRGSLLTTAQLVGAYGGVLALCFGISWRLAGDDSRIAGWLNGGTHTLFELALASVTLLLFTSSAVLLSYVMVALGMPLQDASFAAADRALGIDWLAILSWGNSDPLLAAMLVKAYASNLMQTGGLLVLFVALRRSAALWEYLALLTVSAAITVVISGLVPAINAFHLYQPDASLTRAIDAVIPNIGRTYIGDLVALNNGTFHHFDWKKAEGIIAFPSFHTIMGLVFTYAARHVRLLFWPLAVLNAVMIVSTVPVGGHYVVDVIAGFVVFAVALAVVDRANGRVPFWARLSRTAAGPQMASQPAG